MGKLTCLVFNVLMTSVIYAATTHIAYNELQRGWVYSWDQDCLVLCGCTNMPKSGTLNIPSTLDTYLGPVAISKIAERAFAGCKTLSAVSIPDSVEEIGDYAFSRCENLQTVSMPGNALQHIGVSAFGQCSMLCDFKFPSSVISIGRDAFFRCEGLRSLALPDSIEVIGERAFGACSNLDVTNVPNGIEIIGSSAFEGTAVKSVDLPESLVVMGANSFAFCGELQSVVIRAPIDAIQMGAFYSCSNLETVAIAEGVKEIQLNAFEGDIRLTSVVLPSTLVEIGEDAFRECDLKELALPKSLKVVGSGAFVLNRDIREMCILSEDLTVCGRSFEPVQLLVLGSEFKNFELLQNENAASIRANDIFIQQGMTAIPASAFQSTWCNSISVPESVTSIGNNAFYACRAKKIVVEGEVNLGSSAFEESSIQDIELKIGTSTIPERLFYGCGVLSNVVLSSSVERIEDEAFYGCGSLIDLNWPEQLKYIGKSAFAGCEALTNLNLKATQVEEIGERAFFACWSLIDPVTMPVTLQYVGDAAFYLATVWPDLSVVSSQAPLNSTINFLGPPPVVGDNVFATAFQYGEQWYVYNGIYRGTYVTDYAVEWEKAIEDWSKEHQTEGKWAWLEFSPQIVVEPTAWKMDKPKTGDQTLTIAWHLPTNEAYTIEQAMRDLVAKDCQFAVWRSMENPQSLEDATNFQKAVCIKQNWGETNYVDEAFGIIPGMRPVCYWVEVQREKNAKGRDADRERPEETPAMCITRRRFGVVVGISKYNPSAYSLYGRKPPKEMEVCAKDAHEFSKLLRESGGVVDTSDGGDVRLLCNEEATAHSISRELRDLPRIGAINQLVPGDIAFIWLGSHGTDGEDIGGIPTYDDHYMTGQIMADEVCRNTICGDLAWVYDQPGVRVVGILPICHAEKIAIAFKPVDNLAWICGCRAEELVAGSKNRNQFDDYFLHCGVFGGFANREAFSTRPFSSFNLTCPYNYANGDDKLTCEEAVHYAQYLSIGASSLVPAHAEMINEKMLSTVVLREDVPVVSSNSRNSARVSISAERDENTGGIRLYYMLPDGDEYQDVIIWFRSASDKNWNWVNLEYIYDRKSSPEGFWETLKDIFERFEPSVLFGSRSDTEIEYRGSIKPNTEYQFVAQTVGKNGFGPVFSTVICSTGELAASAKDALNAMLQTEVCTQGSAYWQNAVEMSATVTVQPSDSMYLVSCELEHGGNVAHYSGLASDKDVSNDGELKVTVNCFGQDQEANELQAKESSGSIEWPSTIALTLTADSVYGVGEDFELMCFMVGEVKFDDWKFKFCPGESVILDVSETTIGGSVSYSAKNLPKGLSISKKTGEITGTPTLPGEFAVTVTVMSNVDKSQAETKNVIIVIRDLPVLTTITVGEPNGGKVTGGGAYQANKKVTLKATPGKNSVFSGWYDGEDLVSRLPSYVLTMPPHDLTLYAKFIAQTDDVAAVSFTLPAELTNGVTAVNVPVDVSGCTSLPTVKVTGLPTGLKFTAKALDVKASKGKPAAHYEANTIYGTPTKSGVYTVVATVTTAGKKTASASQTVVVRKPGECVVKAEVPAIDGVVPGKVTGMGVYAKDKKVTLKATANKGYVFAGWYEGEGTVATQAGNPVSRLASYVLTMPTNDVAYVAKFVTTGEDKASITASVNGMDLSGTSGETPLPHCETNVMAGVYLEWPIAASALSETTVKVAGLPSGLKFTAKPVTKTTGSGTSKTVVTNVPANTIYGAPTAASKTAKDKTTGLMTVTPSKVKVTVTTSGKSKAEYVIDLTVDPLPAWAVGEFSGLASTAEGRLGSASMSVTAAGKVSGKVTVNGTNCTFSAASYDSASRTVGETNLVAKIEGKLGKEAVTGGITVVASGAEGAFAGAEMSLCRNVWKDKGAAPVPAEAQGLYTVKLGAGERGTGYLSLTVDKKGAVKVAGKAPDGTALSGSATLMPNGDGAYFTELFAAPSAYKGGYVAGRLAWDADGKVSSDGLDWRSFNPQATADYYANGFDRGLSASGARYVKTDAPKSLGTADVRLETPEGAELKTFSFTQSTGVWKGTLLWDFGDPSLSPVKVPFEGIMVQGEDLEGFGTYDVPASYVPYDKKGNPQKEKTYKVKESLPVSFVAP